MSHSYAQNHVHLVFSTKDRQKLIAKSLQRKLWAYMAGICKHYDMLVFAVGGMEDHVHALFRLPPTSRWHTRYRSSKLTPQSGCESSEPVSHGKKATGPS